MNELSSKRILVTGSAGHLGEALVRRLQIDKHEVAGLDLVDSPFTTHVGSITDPEFVRRCMRGINWVLHTAALHKPHVGTHSRSDFVQTNIAGTLNLLEAAKASGVSSFVFTSTTSTFGAALSPHEGEPAAWITESVSPVAKNIYGVTKAAAEDLCHLFSRRFGLPCLVLRTSRFFPEADDNQELRESFEDGNLKANEYLYRRVDLGDAADAHILAAKRAPAIGFSRYIISASTPFRPRHLLRLRSDAPSVVAELFPDYVKEYACRNWRMLPGIDRVYVNSKAQQELGWNPRYDFCHVLERLKRGQGPVSELATQVGIKGYHAQTFEDGPYPV